MNNPIVVPMTLCEPEPFNMTVQDGETLGFNVFDSVVIAPVKGVKGSAESAYRTGNVSISPADLGMDPSQYATHGEIPTRTSELTNDSNFVSDANYVHTDTNFTAADAQKLNNLIRLGINVGGTTYDVVSFISTTVQGIDGILLIYDDGTPDGGFIFFPDGDGFTTFYQMIQQNYALKTEVPGSTSDLVNDSGFITGSDVPSNEQDPTVPGWAKASSKPSYTASEVGALPDSTVIPSATSQLTNDVPFAVANSAGAALNTMAIPMGAVDSTSTSTVFTATVLGITQLKTGVCMMLSNHVVTSASGFTVNINNLGAKPCYSNMTNATRETTIFNVNYTMLFVYDESLDGGDGGWWCYRGYNSDNNTIGYIVRTNSLQLPVDSVCYRYRLLFVSMDGQHYIPANNSTSTNATAKRNTTQTPFDPFGRIVYYGTTAALSAGGKPSAAYQFEQNTLSLGYSFNRTGAALTLTEDKPVWLKCTPQSDGSVILDAETPYVQALPTTEDGFVYIWLGIAYSATNIELTLEHPVKHYSNGAIRNWFG